MASSKPTNFSRNNVHSSVVGYGCKRVPPELTEKLISILKTQPNPNNGMLCDDLCSKFKKIHNESLNPLLYGFVNVYELLSSLTGKVKVGLDSSSKIIAYAIPEKTIATQKLKKEQPLPDNRTEQPMPDKRTEHSPLSQSSKQDANRITEATPHSHGSPPAAPQNHPVLKEGHTRPEPLSLGVGPKQSCRNHKIETLNDGNAGLDSDSSFSESEQEPEKETGADGSERQRATITALTSNNKIFIQKEADFPKLASLCCTLSKIMNEESNKESLRLLPEDLGVNKTYISRFKDEWRRVKILKFKDRDLVLCSVFLVDYGVTECCRTEDLFRLPAVLKEIPAFASEVELSNVGVETDWSKKVKSKIRCWILQQEDPLWSCRFEPDGVWLENGGHSLNEMVKSLLEEERGASYDVNVHNEIIQSAHTVEDQKLTDTDQSHLRYIEKGMFGVFRENQDAPDFKLEAVPKLSYNPNSGNGLESDDLRSCGQEHQEEVPRNVSERNTFRILVEGEEATIWMMPEDLDNLAKITNGEEIRYKVSILDNGTGQKDKLIPAKNLREEIDKRQLDFQTIDSLIKGIMNAMKENV